MTDTRKLDAIMAELDRWVFAHGSGRYVTAEFVATADQQFGLPEDFGIQQVRSELEEFARTLLAMQRLGSALEIGLGYFGSTHFLWRLLFDRAATIECNKDRILTFRDNCRRFLGKHVLDDGRSSFFFGLSSAPITLDRVRRHFANGLDLLFIDGDHRYEAVVADWLLYHSLVAPGGVVAFHDAVAGISGGGVPRFIEELSAGKIDGVKRDVKRIIHSRDCGVAYYVNG